MSNINWQSMTTIIDINQAKNTFKDDKENGGDKMTNDIAEAKNDILEAVKNVVGNINNIDSRNEKSEIVSLVLNSIIAGVELSKLEKAGILSYLVAKRVG